MAILGGNIMLKPFYATAVLALALCATQPMAQAQTYPERPITIVVPLAAGSGMDSLVRLYADRLPASPGKPVVADNRPGATLLRATPSTAAEPPDGYTLMVSTSSATAINPVLYKKINYKLT